MAEVRFHQARFLAATREPSIEVSMRVYVASLDAMLHDVRGRCDDFPDACVDGPAGYPRSAAFAGRLRDLGSAGIVYDSARRAHGQCAALFRPRAVRLPVHRARGGATGVGRRTAGDRRRLRDPHPAGRVATKPLRDVALEIGYDMV